MTGSKKENSDDLGSTMRRLRKTYSISVSDIASHSGIADSLIRQIEQNEEEPTSLAMWRLSLAFDRRIREILLSADDVPFISHTTPDDVPVLTSEDGKCTLAAIGWVRMAEWLQWYDVHCQPGGALPSRPHQVGSVESLSVLSGTLEIRAGDITQTALAGETVRYRCDLPHTIRNAASTPAHAIMVVILKAAVME